ncbi:Bacteriophage/Gene transfer agent portal protein [uncultured Caudovirales phage]|uniref:Bacteriophage/Gene transfer agent portal protein n=1 Tax=uncultured Caudovirales phage TaxID=2100421 RepID=A0A6J7XLM4_9CAUD|nr:Bacteriophage/Gene transfer agent portal protein [uncultured Caudovirales phage]CAB4192473.1 Bacteriophage/Gene transfer agent portal protein [uncultured Caudovirales phage]CAB4216328.1 Bacteriophage/Gene transfer agent portal protein [uncultured Caudovirales phage]CAB5230527.1 Bacteriophage/Gene transfer agent portal protein [uncultured Caudovirales phage]
MTKRNRKIETSITKQVTDDTKYMTSSVGVLTGTTGGKSAPFSMSRSVNSFQTWVYAAAMLNAQAVASVPLRLYVRTDAQSTNKLWKTRPVSRSRKAYLLGDMPHKPSAGVMKSAAMSGDFEEVTDSHPVLELLRQANRYEDGFGMSVSRILFMELTGNAYLHVVTDPILGVPNALWTVPAQHVTIKPSKTEFIEAYLYGQNSQSLQSFAPDEIIHFKRPNPLSLYYGMGKVEAAYPAVQLNVANMEQDLAMAENMCRPDFAAVIKGQSSEQSMRRFEESMRNLHQGARKTGRMVTMSGDITLTPLSFPSKDMTGRDEIAEIIASCFGVPISMLKANDPNLASAQSGYAMWRETTIAPICRLDEETLNARLLPLFGIQNDAYLAYDNPVPSNRQADTAERIAAVAGGWRTANEARMEEGYDILETPHADMLHVNGIPLGGAPVVSPFGGAVLNSAPIEPMEIVVSEIPKAIEDVDTKPTEEMAGLADRGLELRAEFNRGGTEVGVARARDISNMVSLSPDTINRMNSFFARHRGDLEATGARIGEDGYPTAGAIAWLLWGGDPQNPDGAGVGWAMRKAQEIEAQSKDATKAEDCVGGKISTLMNEGYPHDQAVAVAISMCEGKSLTDALESWTTQREEKKSAARIKMAALEAKAWDEIHHAPKIASLEKQIEDMKSEYKSMAEVMEIIGDALVEVEK